MYKEWSKNILYIDEVFHPTPEKPASFSYKPLIMDYDILHEMIAAGLFSSAENVLQIHLEKNASKYHGLGLASLPTDISSLLEMIGDINERKGEHKRAIEYYSNALQRDDCGGSFIIDGKRIITSSSHNSANNILSSHNEKARMIFKKSLAQLYSPSVDKGAVLKQLESIPSETRDAKINILMGKLYAFMPNYSSAIAAYKTVLQVFPEAIEVVDILIRLGVDLYAIHPTPSTDSWVKLYTSAMICRRNLDIASSIPNWMNLLDRHRNNVTFLARTAETLLLPSKKPISLTALASQPQAVNICVAVRVSFGSFVVNPMELEAAKEVILKARITDPLSLEGMELLARIHFQLGEVEELRKLVDDAAAASDKRPESTLFLAMISILEGKPVKNTLSLISNAIRLDPELSTSFKLKGYLHFLHNEFALAAAAYARAAALDEEFSSYFAVVRAMIAQGDFVEALEAAKKAAISLPHCFYAHLMLGIVRAHGLQGVVERVRSFGKALMLHPLSKTEAARMAAELTCLTSSTNAVDSLVTAISMCASQGIRVQLGKVFSAIDSDSNDLEIVLRAVGDEVGGDDDEISGDNNRNVEEVLKEDFSSTLRNSDERAAAVVPLVPPESQEQWRNRLWPAKALNSFCRIITRCKPPIFTPGKKIHIRTGSDGLTAHWRENELVKVGCSFESITAHNSAFFLLAVEESRECLRDDMSLDDNSEGDVEEDRSTVALSPWRDCEVTSIISESEYGGMPKICDPRLGSVWVVSVSYLPSPNDEGGSHKLPTLNGGDLMLLYSTQWDHSLIGIVQPWDPDYYMKFGTINTSGYSAAGTKGALGSFNLLLCVEHNEACQESIDTDIGGWANQGTIMRGIKFSIARIGNVMTGIRECQALMSLKLIDRSLQRMIIDAPTSSVENEELLPLSSSSAPSTTMSDPFICPANVPTAMWATFRRIYNESQLLAIKRVCMQYTNKDSSITLLQGPPGTGKTKTVLAIVSVFLCGTLFQTNLGKVKIIAGASLTVKKPSADYGESASSRGERSDSIDGIWAKKPRVLLCAPSNTAVDELAYRLLTQGVVGSDGRKLDLNVVRVGHGAFYKDKQDNESAKNKRQSDEMRRVVHRVSLDYLVEEKMKQHKANESVSKQFLKYIDIRKKVLEKADVVCCTLSCAGSQPVLEVALRITGFQFDAVIIDEAGQAVEPSALIPFKYNPHAVVMVGDTCQLPAKVFSWASKAANYEQSLFQRLQLAGHPVTMLQTQYRMHPEIADYPSRRFYKGKLLTDSELIRSRSHEKPYHFDRSARFRPFVFHDVEYGTETQDGCSFCNQSEVQYVLWLYKRLQEKYSTHATNIGVIAPYTGQRKLLTRGFAKIGGGTSSNSAVEVSTVDGFQGREKNIIIFSCTRAPSANKGRLKDTGTIHTTGGSSKNDIGFLKVWQRLNVAITRAKYSLWIVGHAQTLKQDSEWAALINYAEEKRSIIRIHSLEGQGNDRSRPPNMMSSHSSLATTSFDEATIRPSTKSVSNRGVEIQMPKVLSYQEKRSLDGIDISSGRISVDRGELNQTRMIIEHEQCAPHVGNETENKRISNINQKEVSEHNPSSSCNNNAQKPAEVVAEKDVSRPHKGVSNLSTSSVITNFKSCNEIKVEKDSTNNSVSVGQYRYLEKKGNQETLFFQISSRGNTVTLCTGTKGCAGVNSSQIFDNDVKARQFVQCVVLQKCIAGFQECHQGPCDMPGERNAAKRKSEHSTDLFLKSKKIR